MSRAMPSSRPAPQERPFRSKPGRGHEPPQFGGLPSGQGYDRKRELPRLLPIWPHEIEDDTPAGRRRLVLLLGKALRAERRRGIAGHWTYDLARHAQLLRAYRLERAALEAEHDSQEPG